MEIPQKEGLHQHAVFLPVDYKTYSQVSKKVKDILKGFSSIIENVGIDEAFLDISQIDMPSENIAKEIKKRVRDATGLTCSIGIAPNKLLAKIASDIQKPDGLTIITEGDIARYLWLLPVRKLWGIGPKTEKHLKEMGIETIRQLASIPLDKLTDRFGPSYGTYLYHASKGIDDNPLITHWEPKSMSRETTFQKDVANWQVIAKTLAGLTREVVVSMKQAGYKGRTFTVKIRFSDFETLTRGKTLPQSTDSEERIRKSVFECLKRIELKKKVRLIGIRIGNLERVDEILSPHL